MSSQKFRKVIGGMNSLVQKEIEKIREPVGSRRLVWMALAVGLAYVLLAALYVTVVLNLHVPAAERGLSVWAQEPRGPDSHDYDNIALCIAKGKGFATDWTDPEYRKPYETSLAKGYTYWRQVLARSSSATPTAYRPPVYPAALGAMYFVFGRNFVLQKVMDCLFIGMCGGLVFLMAARLPGGARAGLAAAGLLATSLRMWSCARWGTTEAMALMMVAGALYALLLAMDRPNWRRLALAGLLFAGAVLTRSALIFCLPFAVVAILVSSCCSWPARLRRVGVYAGACALPLFLWSLRNSLVGGQLVLLSTQGTMALPAGYTQACLEAEGAWVPKLPSPYAEEMRAAKKAGGEWASARKGSEIFRRLLRRNWRLVPRLIAVKTWTMIPVPYKLRDRNGDWALPYDLGDALIFYLAVLGVFVIGKGSLRWVALTPILGTFLCCALLFAESRFRIPMLPGLAILAGAGLCYILTLCRRGARREFGEIRKTEA